MTERAQLPSISMLDRLLICDAAKGVLFWRRRSPDLFSSGKQRAEHNCAIWNGKFAGRRALNSSDHYGYLTGTINYRRLKAHRVIWAMTHGAWPDGEIDHIDGNPSNNRLINLRLVTHHENGRNLKLNANNKSGACGVWQRPSGRWLAKITIKGKAKTIGTFDRFEEAVAARIAANSEHGFHQNHGGKR